MTPLTKQTADILISLLPLTKEVTNGIIGYDYDIRLNPLGLSPADISKYANNGITDAESNMLLRSEYFDITYKLSQKYAWVSDLDSVTLFVITSCVKVIGLSKITNHPSLLNNINLGKFNIASLELQKLGVNKRIIDILRSGRLV